MPEPAAPELERIAGRALPRSIAHMALGEDPSRPRAAGTRLQPPALNQRLDQGVRSCPLKAPRTDWERLCHGSKRMFRTYAGRRQRFARLFDEGEEFPRPAVMYSQPEHDRRYDVRLAVVTGYRQEPLGAIPPEDLEREGFESIRDFRRYWKGRYIRWGWRPYDLVSVVELRPWQPADDHEQAEWLLRRLYGEWL